MTSFLPIIAISFGLCNSVSGVRDSVDLVAPLPECGEDLDITNIGKLGSGAEAMVYEAKFKGSIVAVKVQEFDEEGFGGAAINDLVKQCAIMRDLFYNQNHQGHPRVPDCFGVCDLKLPDQKNATRGLIMQVLRSEPAPNFFKHPKDKAVLEFAILDILYNVAAMLNLGYMEFDLQPFNMMINPNGQAYIFDFGQTLDFNEKIRKAQSGGLDGVKDEFKRHFPGFLAALVKIIKEAHCPDGLTSVQKQLLRLGEKRQLDVGYRSGIDELDLFKIGGDGPQLVEKAFESN